jgi:hypothetical protein
MEAAQPIPLEITLSQRAATGYGRMQYVHTLLTFCRIGRLWCGETADQPEEIIGMAWHASPGPLDTSLEYFYHEMQGEIQEMIALHPNDPDWFTACWVLKSSLPYIIIEDRVRGPFPLCHMDLHFGNLLFDDQYNLKGVIDWSNAQAAPLEQLAACPEFVTFPGLSAEGNQRIIDFKHLVTKFVKEMELEAERLPPLDNQHGEEGKQNRSPTHLPAFMATKSAEVTLRHYMASPKKGLWFGKVVAKLIYGENIK